MKPPSTVLIFCPVSNAVEPVDPTAPSPSTLANEYGKQDTVQSISVGLKEAGVLDVRVVDVKLGPGEVERVVREAATLREELRLLHGLGLEKAEWEPLVVLNLCDGTEEDGYPVSSSLCI
jgi:hypothetical protein